MKYGAGRSKHFLMVCCTATRMNSYLFLQCSIRIKHQRSGKSGLAHNDLLHAEKLLATLAIFR